MEISSFPNQSNRIKMLYTWQGTSIPAKKKEQKMRAWDFLVRIGAPGRRKKINPIGIATETIGFIEVFRKLFYIIVHCCFQSICDRKKCQCN